MSGWTLRVRELWRAICETHPDAVVHCAGWTAVDAAEDSENRGLVHKINVDGTRYLADACKKAGCKMLYLYGDKISLENQQWLQKLAAYNRNFQSRAQMALSNRYHRASANMGLSIRLAFLMGNR